MTVIGSLKRIARRPSLLLNKGAACASTRAIGPNDTDSDEEECLEIPAKETSPKTRRWYDSKRKGGKDSSPTRVTAAFPPHDLRGSGRSGGRGGGTGRTTPPKQSPYFRKTQRRASTGGGGPFDSLAVSCHPDIQVSVEQRQRIERLKTRRRNSALGVQLHNSLPGANRTPGASRHTATAQEELERMSPTTRARRHSLSSGTNSQQPKALYTVRPEQEPPQAPPRMETTHKTLSFVRRNSLSSQNVSSMRSLGSKRSLGSGTVKTNQSGDTLRSGSSHRSNSSAFSSTGWSIAPGSESPRRSPRRASRLKSGSIKASSAHGLRSGIKAHSGHGIGLSLYTPTNGSTRSLDSSDSDCGSFS